MDRGRPGVGFRGSSACKGSGGNDGGVQEEGTARSQHGGSQAERTRGRGGSFALNLFIEQREDFTE